MSIARILDMLSGRTSEVQPRQQHDPLRLATAAVLLDIAYADGQFTPAEDGNVVGFLTKRFSLSPDDARELLEAADEIRKKTVDHFALTNYIRKNTPLAERIDIVKTMWHLVYSDGHLSEYEGYLVRKLADLLGLEHHVMIDTKSAVLRELGRSES
ncbi:MAG: TerB family tellurite resistance protein [Thermoanaerobaculia bacterium]